MFMLLAADTVENLKIPFLLIEEHHNASDVGDEPLLISRHTNVWVSRKKETAFYPLMKQVPT